MVELASWGQAWQASWGGWLRGLDGVCPWWVVWLMGAPARALTPPPLTGSPREQGPCPMKGLTAVDDCRPLLGRSGLPVDTGHRSQKPREGTSGIEWTLILCLHVPFKLKSLLLGGKFWGQLRALHS